MTAAQWLVLDNLKHGWSYRANVRPSEANQAYQWASDNGYIADGKLTSAGEMVLMLDRAIEAAEERIRRAGR